MEIVLLLIPLALIVLALAIGVFFWAIRNEQFDDLDSPAWKIVFDDVEARKGDSSTSESHESTEEASSEPHASERTLTDNNAAPKNGETREQKNP